MWTLEEEHREGFQSIVRRSDRVEDVTRACHRSLRDGASRRLLQVAGRSLWLGSVCLIPCSNPPRPPPPARCTVLPSPIGNKCLSIPHLKETERIFSDSRMGLLLFTRNGIHLLNLAPYIYYLRSRVDLCPMGVTHPYFTSWGTVPRSGGNSLHCCL